MSVMHLALVSESRHVPTGGVNQVAAALQRQISRDFAPAWGLDAAIDAFASLDEVPPGYWPIIVRDALPMNGVLGIHLDERGQPFALVKANSTWSLSASHEALEMLADPQGNRLIPGGSLKRGQGIVDFLVEVCDPCGAPRYAYTVNGVLVSDFITPAYYDPKAVSGVRYSFSGAMRRPRGLLAGGYVAWREPTTGEWWRAERRDGRERITPLGVQPSDGRPLRERIDEENPLTFLYDGVPLDDPVVVGADVRYVSSRAASRASAEQVHSQIERLIAGAPKRGRPLGASRPVSWFERDRPLHPRPIAAAPANRRARPPDPGFGPVPGPFRDP